MEQLTNLTIIYRDPNDQITEYASDSSVFTYVASTIKLALSMMSCPQGRAALAQLAVDFDDTQSSTWYHGFSEDRTRPNQLVDLFLSKIAASFPLVVIDEKMTDPRNLAYHPRGQWNNDFNPRGQVIILNSGRIRDMITSVNLRDWNQVRTFQFMFANTFVHEVGVHVLITFLGQGRPMTPPQPPFDLDGYSDSQAGESGRTLETFLFGGTMEYYRDANHSGNDQPGIPHIMQGNRAFKIKGESVERTIDYDFRFPYEIDQQPTSPSAMRTMGHPALNADPATDPTIRNLIVHAPQGYNISVADWSILRQVPANPSLRVQAA